MAEAKGGDVHAAYAEMGQSGGEARKEQVGVECCNSLGGQSIVWSLRGVEIRVGRGRVSIGVARHWHQLISCEVVVIQLVRA